MIEVTNIRPLRKGSLLATCDVYIVPWDMEIFDIKVFEKGANRWVGMPSKEVPSADVDKKYIELINFRKANTRNRFKSQILDAINKELQINPEMKPMDVIKETDDFPF